MSGPAEPAAAVESATPSALSAAAVVERGSFRLDVALEVAAGEVVAVVGPNGAGKTTLLRALAGLLPLTAGRLVLDGTVLDDPAAGVFVPAERRRVGVVFQDYLLFEHLDARDNVAFGLRARRLAGRAAARATAVEWLERLDLAGLERRRPRELSGGQAQRVALARALATEPGLLLLDEPLAALDAGTRVDVRSRLTTTLRGRDIPVVLVTHDPLDAMTLADRMVVVEGGRVVQDGTPAEVARRPRTPYVARLVGLNLYAGKAAGGWAAVGPGVSIGVPPGGPAGSVLVALRPSSVALFLEQPHGSPRTVLAGTVTGVEPFGDRVRVLVDAGVPLLADITADALAELRLVPGSRIWAAVKATDVDVYPA